MPGIELSHVPVNSFIFAYTAHSYSQQLFPAWGKTMEHLGSLLSPRWPYTYLCISLDLWLWLNLNDMLHDALFLIRVLMHRTMSSPKQSHISEFHDKAATLFLFLINRTLQRDHQLVPPYYNHSGRKPTSTQAWPWTNGSNHERNLPHTIVHELAIIFLGRKEKGTI